MTTTGELYATATQTRDLRQSPGCVKDIDVLMAAGMSASRDPRKALALAVCRASVSGDHSGLRSMAEALADWVAGYLCRGGRRQMHRVRRVDLCEQVLRYWLDQGCKFCDGLGYKKVPGTPHLSAHECPQCHGTGKRPIASVIGGSDLEPGRWLAAELDGLVASIHGDMARRLTQKVGP